jgi:putative transposase
VATVGEATENGSAERLMRAMKEEVALHEYTDFHAAYQGIGCFQDPVYQHKRLYSAWAYLTPAECETQ